MPKRTDAADQIVGRLRAAGVSNAQDQGNDQAFRVWGSSGTPTALG